MVLSNEQRKAYRTIGHKLNPIVTIAEKGLSDNVREELGRALDDHELIKIKLAVGERELKKQVLELLCASMGVTLVQQIGNTALLLRHNPQAKPKLSNLKRFQ